MFPVKLNNPICFFDIESTGIVPRADRIIELAIIKINPDGTEIEKEWLLNPGIPIPQETTAIHGITDEIVKSCPTFPDVAHEIRAFIADSDLGGFNITRFDIPILCEEFLRAGVMFEFESRRIIDAQKIFHAREPRNLAAALAFYCNKEHTDAHGAIADTRATIDVVIGQFQRYTDLPSDIDELDQMFNPRDPFNADRAGRFRWVDNKLTINFGKKKGALVEDLIRDDPNFLKWICRSDFPRDTRTIAENALDGKLPPPPRPKAPPSHRDKASRLHT
ncbi:MAG: 3'-5' exonuclease [Lentisphaerae bacterium]|nr:3'-5' exonuclease [Lentisphaerota bacterium]